MALPCHLIAQKCHSSKLLQAKPLKGLGRRIPNSADASHPEGGELSAADQMLDLDLQVHHHHQAAHPDIIVKPRTPTVRGERPGNKQGCPLGWK
jgi:hypothetical protein